MKTIESDRGRIIKAPLGWVDFVVSNPDIMAALNQSPLRGSRMDDGKFHLTIFGVNLRIEPVHHELSANRGELKSFSDIRLPWGLGSTHTIAKYSYVAVDERTTALELSLSVELTTFLMRLYASFYRDGIERYLNKICADIEKAAKFLNEGQEQTAESLDDGQKDRIAEVRRSVSHHAFTDSQSIRRFEGAMRVITSDSALLVAAEARMPDQRILSASGRFSLTPEEKEVLLSGIANLASINNRAMPVRGGTPTTAPNADFRQVALEYGCQFYRRVCSNQLSSVVPVITNQGQAAYFRLTVEGEAEQLPWEAMHDGQEFICIRTCFSRSITTIHDETKALHDWANKGILIVGADSRGDLPGVEQETKNIGRILASAGGSKVEVLFGLKANRKNVMRALQSGDFGILHFSGHSVFNHDHPYQSAMDLCAGTQIYLHELGHLGHSSKREAPLGLVFLNSCQSAMIGHDSVTGRQLSMCKALREAGVSYVIGMLWNVEDEAAVQVGANFYRHLLENPHKGPESAMRETRLSVAIERTWSDGSWLAPVLYS